MQITGLVLVVRTDFSDAGAGVCACPHKPTPYLHSETKEMGVGLTVTARVFIMHPRGIMLTGPDVSHAYQPRHPACSSYE